MKEAPEKETLLEFPCRFPLKMMGRKESSFRETAIGIIERHAGTIDADAVRAVPSSAGNFLSLTVTIDVQSKSQLDRIYRDLSASDEILVAL